jgi:hypothetical protein
MERKRRLLAVHGLEVADSKFYDLLQKQINPQFRF